MSVAAPFVANRSRLAPVAFNPAAPRPIAGHRANTRATGRTTCATSHIFLKFRRPATIPEGRSQRLRERQP
jgi:hypothetical protein